MIFGPTDFWGWSYKLTPVCLYVILSLRHSIPLCDDFWAFLHQGSFETIPTCHIMWSKDEKRCIIWRLSCSEGYRVLCLHLWTSYEQELLVRSGKVYPLNIYEWSISWATPFPIFAIYCWPKELHWSKVCYAWRKDYSFQHIEFSFTTEQQPEQKQLRAQFILRSINPT